MILRGVIGLTYSETTTEVSAGRYKQYNTMEGQYTATAKLYHIIIMPSNQSLYFTHSDQLKFYESNYLLSILLLCGS